MRQWGPFHKDVCVQCPYTFTSWDEHRTHVKEAHGDVWRYICGLCDVLFPTKDERNRHRKDDHESRLKERVSCYLHVFCVIAGRLFRMWVSLLTLCELLKKSGPDLYAL